MMIDVVHPTLGALKLPGIPVKLSESPGEVRKAPPLVGEDNDAVYRDLLGFSAERIAQLKADGAI
jgi:crotonobetainyl-CoA:carnitine CoA-transferase CaiB-like acyl-CoA transferase